MPAIGSTSALQKAITGAVQLPGWARILIVVALVYGGGSLAGFTLPTDPGMRLEMILVCGIAYLLWDTAGIKAERKIDNQRCRDDLERLREESADVRTLASAVLVVAEEMRELRKSVGAEGGIPQRGTHWDRVGEPAVTPNEDESSSEISPVAVRRNDPRHATTSIHRALVGVLAVLALTGCATRVAPVGSFEISPRGSGYVGVLNPDLQQPDEDPTPVDIVGSLAGLIPGPWGALGGALATTLGAAVLGHRSGQRRGDSTLRRIVQGVESFRSADRSGASMLESHLSKSMDEADKKTVKRLKS
jgi:hypothetical protein